MVTGTPLLTTESPLISYLPSVIAFMERMPLFVEYFTTREVVFAFPRFLENYTLHISSSDTAVGEIGEDGWVEISSTVPGNLSSDMFFNLTLLDAFSYDAFGQEDSDAKGDVNPDDNEEDFETFEEGGLNAKLMRRLKDLRLDDVTPLASNFTLIGHRFGKTTLSFKLYREVDGEMVLDPVMTAIAKDVDVLNMRIPTAFDLAFGTVMLVLGAMVTGIMGCELEWAPLKKILKRPFGVVIGFFSQFIIMPLTAFVMCIIFDLSADHAIGIILAACSPGGGLSNMTSVAIDANLLLSIAMTFFSTIIALGMMPLNLFIYSRRFQDEDSFPIPFTKIIIGLVTMIGPLLAGCLLRVFKEKWALFLIKLLKPVSLVVIIFALAGGVYTIRFVFTYIVPGMIVCSFSIPFIAFFLGGFAAFLCRRDFTQVKTIAIETAIQNVGVGAGIVRLVYPSPDADIITCAILWTLLGQSCLIFSVIGAYMMYKKILKKRCGVGGKKLENEAEEVDDSEGKRASMDAAEMVPLNKDDDDDKQLDTVSNGSVHAHLTRMNRARPPSAGMTMGAYRFWGYRPLLDGPSADQAKAAPGLFVTFPAGLPNVQAMQLWAPPIIGPTGDVWVPDAELFRTAPESTV
ncbi:ileal sodium/bile acid cotransporter-like isoform X2 [Acanthaster planci]|nr:ileal sodium/bile acid cotransporter-like isoform X2 [Acanthaster planci]